MREGDTFAPRRRLKAVNAAVLIASLAAAAAAQPAPAKIMTWQDCVALALQRSPDLASSRYAEQSGQASYRQSFNGLFPGVTLTNSYNNSSFMFPGSSKWNADVGANVNLLSASAIAGVRTSAAALAQARGALAQTSATVRYGLRQAFDQVLFAQASVDVSRGILGLRRKDAELVTLRYQSGHEYKGNMMQFQAELLSAQADLRSSLRDLRAARKALDRQLGLDDFTEIQASGTLTAAAAPALPADLSAFAAARPDVAVQEAVVAGSRAAVEQAQSSFWPSLSANFSRGRQGPTEFPDQTYNWTYGGVLSYPLFAGGPTAAFEAVSAAKKNVLKSEQDLRTVRDAAISDLESAWSSYADAVDQLNAQTALLAANRQRNDEADIRYASGLLIFENWEVVVSERVSSERSALQAALAAANAEANWERAVGKLLGD